MLQRNLLYTGVTRGKPLVVLVGQKNRHCGAQRLRAAAVVEADRMAAPPDGLKVVIRNTVANCTRS
jgi:ATP-dependent exoDNAse (exonuclease V) alpha subunit